MQRLVLPSGINRSLNLSAVGRDERADVTCVCLCACYCHAVNDCFSSVLFFFSGPSVFAHMFDLEN